MATKTQQTPTSAKYPPHDMCSILSQKKLSKQDVNVASITYLVSASKICSKHSLMDRGANGGIAGQDVKVIATSDCSVDIQGIDNHQVTDVKIGTIAGVIKSTKGPIIGIMHQYALVGHGHPFILLGNGNGSSTKLTTNPFTLVVNNKSRPLMDTSF